MLLILSLSYCIQAQNKIIPLNLSLWDPVSLFRYDSTSTTFLNIGILHNKSANVNGITTSTLFSTTTGTLNGLSLNGVVGVHEGAVNGLTVSGLVNVTSGQMRGVNYAGFMNMNINRADGLQIAGATNFNIGDFNGFQSSGMTNFTAGTMTGVQLTGAINIVGCNVFGIQMSTLLNISMGDLSGVQIALSNYARSVKGAQIGLFNAAGRGVRGVQIGFINYSYEKASLKLGLINVSPATRLQLMLFSGNTQYANFAARFKNKYTFTQIGFGFPSYISPKTFSGEISYRAGLILPIKRFSISGDLGVSHILLANKNDAPNDPHKLYSLQGRISAEYQLFDRFALFASGGYKFNSRYKEFESYQSKPIFEFGIALF